MTSYPDLRNEYETDPTPKQSQCRTLKPSSVVLSKKVIYIYKYNIQQLWETRMMMNWLHQPVSQWCIQYDDGV
jgi:hypothetical protein